ncbi:MAG: 2-phospho-L-lactate guanylyltransferase [Proteobacteria bacterium]|nr:2-phospho-L-lactate guanylyltransferase [Pseudomonadota bacterium]
MSTWALVPVKARQAGKLRLAGELPDALRAQLVRRMLDDVLAALAASGAVDGTVVMSPERDLLPAMLRVLQDSAAEMNAALELAREELERGGATCLAVVAADLPLVAPGDVTALIEAARTGGVALAPDAAGTGTNAVALRLPTAFRFHFGPGSLALHRAEAARHGLTATAVTTSGLGFDVDAAADLARLRSQRLPRYAFLG